MNLGLGGGCHWCTEGVFQQLDFVSEVKQGWISCVENEAFSEAVTLTFDGSQKTLEKILFIHLMTHSSTSAHSMRSKYRSAIYIFDEEQREGVRLLLSRMKSRFEKPLITKILMFKAFKLNDETYLNYYIRNPDAPFCKRYIEPKIEWLKSEGIRLT